MNAIAQISTGALAILLAGCGSPKLDVREGPAENDPNSPYTNPGSDTGSLDVDAEVGDNDTDRPTLDPRWDDVETTPTEQTVCFPGPNNDNTVCLPTVAWSEDWGSPYAYPDPLDDNPQYNAPARYFDLYADELDPALEVAPNFVLGEFLQDYKGRFGIFQPHAVVSLQTIRDWIAGPLLINSAYRNVEYNAGVGGAEWSRHMYGDAVDMRSNSATLGELAAMCEELGAGFTSVYTSHVHCDWRDTPLEPGFFDPAGEAATAGTPTGGPSAHVERLPSGALQVVAHGFDEGAPLVTWTTRDADGHVLVRGIGPEVQPDRAARMLELDVGRAVQLRVAL